jgi:hypothetical protein
MMQWNNNNIYIYIWRERVKVKGLYYYLMYADTIHTIICPLFESISQYISIVNLVFSYVYDDG